MSEGDIELSIVVPFFNEEDTVAVLFSSLLPILRGLGCEFEVICVNDGSSDATLQALLQYRQQEPRIVILDFSANFGKEAALKAGFDHARGRAVIPMDCDLQDPPEVIPELVKQWRDGYEVVHARRAHYGDSPARRATAVLYYKFLSAMTKVSIPQDVGDFRLMDRKVVDIIKVLVERQRFTRGLVAWVGFKSTVVEYQRPQRTEGYSKYNFRRLWNLALDGITGFSMVPLKIWTFVGVCVSLVSFIFAAFIVLRTLIYGSDVPGFASLIVVVLLLGGLQLMGIGLLGEYLGRTYLESKQRPIYILRSVYRE